MIKMLRISWDIQRTYQVNSILYSLKQVPILRRLLPEQLYRVCGLKIFAAILSFFWGFFKLFGGKALYFAICLVWPLKWYSALPEQESYLHILLFLTVIGTIINTGFADGSYQRYYAVNLLRMNAKKYTLAQFAWEMTKLVLGFLPFSLLFGWSNRVPLWFCILIPFCVVGGKLFAVAKDLRAFERRGGVIQNNFWLQWGSAAALLIPAYGLPFAGVLFPTWLSMTLLLLMLVQGLLSLPVLCRFSAYRQLNQQAMAEFFNNNQVITQSAQNTTRNQISQGGTVSEDKKGLEYLNALFIKRHRKLLWRTTWMISGACGIAAVVSMGVLWILPGIRANVQEGVLHTLPVWSFILYFINRGTGFTRALFINCDHSLLTYSFYKQPKTVLKLFQIRLREITKINAIPALILSLGLDGLLWTAGGGSWIEYLVIPVTLLSMSLFFSIHYLTLYYLLQPYNAGTELKSGTYQIVTGLTYFVCYMLSKTQLPAMLFGLLCIGFCLTYSVIACVLVYRIAPRTFRIRP